MENTRMAMLTVMMLVMGNILIETEAISFEKCYTPCIAGCAVTAHGIKKVLCPFTCVKVCTHPSLSSEANLKEINHTVFYCNLGCVTDRCVSSSSIEDEGHVEKVSECVEACSQVCPNTN